MIDTLQNLHDRGWVHILCMNNFLYEIELSQKEKYCYRATELDIQTFHCFINYIDNKS